MNDTEHQTSSLRGLVLSYQSPPARMSGLAVAIFAVSIVMVPGFFLVFPPLFAWVFAMGISTELDVRPTVAGQSLARAAVHISGWSAACGVLLFLAVLVRSIL